MDVETLQRKLVEHESAVWEIFHEELGYIWDDYGYGDGIDINDAANGLVDRLPYILNRLVEEYIDD